MLDPQQERFISRQRVARLATADAGGQPHVVPVCFAYLDGAFYTPVDEKPKRSLRLKRLRNIAQNPRVALLLDEYDEDWSRLAWLMVQGEAEVLQGGPEHLRAVEELRRRYPQYRSMALESRPLVRIVPLRVLSWRAEGGRGWGAEGGAL
ncbi:MAG TPA: TIGR03668 family PPOX class F420-dependent oxidoreductase [Dehalococcoidia bacterium]|nr:TIGR03668 family PPOX class F420-dependent oxidoreductase [Dehalococcoidia bacterium]